MNLLKYIPGGGEVIAFLEEIPYIDVNVEAGVHVAGEIVLCKSKSHNTTILTSGSLIGGAYLKVGLGL